MGERPGMIKESGIISIIQKSRDTSEYVSVWLDPVCEVFLQCFDLEQRGGGSLTVFSKPVNTYKTDGSTAA